MILFQNTHKIKGCVCKSFLHTELHNHYMHICTLMLIHPFTSRVVRVSEQDFDNASRHESVTPTIPKRLQKQ
jgi:hypothetical protein